MGAALPRIRPSRFVHVLYRTRQFDEMLRWYQTVFDARMQHRDPALASQTYDDEPHRFAFANLNVLQAVGGEHERRGARHMRRSRRRKPNAPTTASGSRDQQADRL